MQIDRRSVARMGFEAFLIVFSVLLALFLDDAWSRHVEEAATREQLWKIGAMLGEREAHQPEHLSDTLVVLEVSLQELQGREYLLAQVYENALDAVDGGACVR